MQTLKRVILLSEPPANPTSYMDYPGPGFYLYRDAEDEEEPKRTRWWRLAVVSDLMVDTVLITGSEAPSEELFENAPESVEMELKGETLHLPEPLLFSKTDMLEILRAVSGGSR